METDKIKALLGKYYSGDILPEEYQSLLSALKTSVELTPELEAERRMLLMIESCEPTEPKGFEDRLIMAIDRQSKRRKNFFRLMYSGYAAAIALIIATIGLHLMDNNNIRSNSISDEDLEKSAQVADEALMEVLTSVQMAKNEVIETIDNIEISQTVDYNIL